MRYTKLRHTFSVGIISFGVIYYFCAFKYLHYFSDSVAQESGPVNFADFSNISNASGKSVLVKNNATAKNITNIVRELNVTSVSIKKNAFNSSNSQNQTKNKKSLPVIVKIIAGMGNQLFMFSAAYAVAKKRNSDLYICVDPHPSHAVSNPSEKRNKIYKTFNPIDRNFILDIFDIPMDKILFAVYGTINCKHEILPGYIRYPENILYINEFDILRREIYDANKFVQLYGYMESEVFFKDCKDELIKLLQLNIDPIPMNVKNILDAVVGSESVSVHVRRGDFITNPVDNRTMPMSYYSKALKLVEEILAEENTTKIMSVFVFSDDIEKVKKEFKSLFQNESYNMIFVSNQNFSSVIDFYLMSHCKHNIIANSSYSWWAAYLNLYYDKIVVAPLPKFIKSWMKAYPEGVDRKIAKKIYRGEWAYPGEWITINPLEPDELDYI